jgi:hypothetical protein
MTTRTIVTSHPGVACDLCGRRLLRGERPDVFLGGGHRRTVCELCSPRAAHEGWQRESAEAELDHNAAAGHGGRPARGRSLLGRIGWRGAERSERPLRAARRDPLVAAEPTKLDASRPASAEPAASSLDREWDGIGAQWAAPTTAAVETVGTVEPTSTEQAPISTEQTPISTEQTPTAPTSIEPIPTAIEQTPAGTANDPLGTLDPVPGDPDPTAALLIGALELFNASEHPRRIAGVTRALGPACLKVAPLAGSRGTVAIVAAWELCWYRYEVDLDDETAPVRLAAEGMELEELAAEDRVANAAADERGEIALLAP